MSGSSHKETTKLLVATAIGAGCAGAVLAVTIVKMLEKKEKIRTETTLLLRSRPSVIMSDRDLSMGGAERNEKLMPHQHEEKMRRRIQARALVEEDNFQPRNSVTVRVPATSANMGPGCTYSSTAATTTTTDDDQCNLIRNTMHLNKSKHLHCFFILL
jgi:hypothetical protein